MGRDPGRAAPCGTRAVTPAALRAELGTIRATFELGDFAALPPLLEQHAEHVQAFCAQPDARGFRDEIRALQAEQQQVVTLLRGRQRELLELMRAQHQSTRAARVYAQAGMAR